MAPRSAQPSRARDRRDSTILRHAAAMLRRRVFLAERRPALRPAEALRFAEALDAAARDIESLGLGLRASLLEAASTIQETPAEDPSG
ncbi:MAG: hypothetical protein ACRDJC_26655, partial [Thermomicrobiales bacterium]